MSQEGGSFDWENQAAKAGCTIYYQQDKESSLYFLD